MTTTLWHNNFEQALTAGLHWLYHTEQPAQALVERCGVRITTSELRLRFLPMGLDGAPVIVVELKPARMSLREAHRATCDLAQTELATLAATLTDRGLHPDHGHLHGDHGAVALQDLAHPSLRAAVARYSRGCPWHHTLVCDAPISAGGQACPWHADGHNAAIWPTSTTCSCQPAAATFTRSARR
ncbi:hypothetical protein [Mycolicibacterium llatzerense]|uniref:hypothetical protein n=1 Tax=Mycolicibacterium llatzerense TaxID=280871 RepID=UPI0031E1CD65